MMLGKHGGKGRVHKLLSKSGYGKTASGKVSSGSVSEHHDVIAKALKAVTGELKAVGEAPKSRLDRKPRASGGGIHIKPSHKGLLTKEVGKEGLKPANLRKEIAKDKAEGNVAKEKREVFALNAKTKFKH